MDELGLLCTVAVDPIRCHFGSSAPVFRLPFAPFQNVRPAHLFHLKTPSVHPCFDLGCECFVSYHLQFALLRTLRCSLPLPLSLRVCLHADRALRMQAPNPSRHDPPRTSTAPPHLRGIHLPSHHSTFPTTCFCSFFSSCTSSFQNSPSLFSVRASSLSFVSYEIWIAQSQMPTLTAHCVPELVCGNLPLADMRVFRNVRANVKFENCRQVVEEEGYERAEVAGHNIPLPVPVDPHVTGIWSHEKTEVPTPTQTFSKGKAAMDLHLEMVHYTPTLPALLLVS